MAIQLIEKNGRTSSETRAVGKLSQADHLAFSQSLRETGTVLSVTDGWQEAAWEAAKRGCPFSIEGIYSSHDIGFCNVVASAYGYWVTTHRGLAAFSRPAARVATQLRVSSSP